MAEPSEDVFPWEAGVFDAHCHPTDIMKDIPMIQEMKARALTIMSTRSEDQHLVELTAQVYGIRSRDDVEKANPGTNQKVVPAFGWHPWFTCQLYDDTAADATYDPNGDPEKEKLRHYAAVLRNVAPGKASVTENPTFVSGLPDPRPLSAFLDETRRRLLRYPYALVGEIGLDGMARLPEAWTEDQKDARDGNITRGTREGRPLTSYVTTKDHQVRVFQAQLALAAELERAVSIHLVDSGGAMWETLKSSWKGHELKFKTKKERHAPTKPPQPEPPKPKPYPPRICMHSFSGNPRYGLPIHDRHSHHLGLSSADTNLSAVTSARSWIDTSRSSSTSALHRSSTCRGAGDARPGSANA